MKRLFSLSLVLVLLAVSAASYAGFPSINTGNSIGNKVVNTGVSTAKNQAIASDINKKIKSYNCKFKNNSTTEDTTCSLDQVIQAINSRRKPLEALGLANIYINVKAGGDGKTAYKRAQHVRDVLYGEMNWWRYSVSGVKNNSNDLDITVSVKD